MAPHQCVHCSKLYPDAAPELLKGCSCGAKFFFYIRKDKYEKIKHEEEKPIVLDLKDKEQVEQDVREMVGAKETEPVILDLESIKVIKPGKFEIDLVNLFRKDRPLIYKLEEGKYIIDLASSLQVDEKIKKRLEGKK